MPEIGVLIGEKLALARQTLERLAFPDGAGAFHEVDGLGGKDKESAVDPCAVAVGFFDESGDEIATELDAAESAGG